MAGRVPGQRSPRVFRRRRGTGECCDGHNCQGWTLSVITFSTPHQPHRPPGNRGKWREQAGRHNACSHHVFECLPRSANRTVLAWHARGQGFKSRSYKRTRTVGAGSFEFSVAELGGDVFTLRRPRKPVIIEKSFAGMRGISPFQGSSDRMIGWGQPLIPIVGEPDSCVDRWGWLGRPGTKTVSCP